MTVPLGADNKVRMEAPSWDPFLVAPPLPVPEADADAVALTFARAAFRNVAASPLSYEALRVLGRSIGDAAPLHIDGALAAFHQLGLGSLRLEKLDGPRYRFAANDLPRVPVARHPSCALALGFLESIVARETHGHALGAEMTCRSAGHEECTFVVRGRVG